MTSSYWLDFLTMAGAHLLAVASPGPDMALVIRQSARYGSRGSFWSSIGIGLGILVHVAYSLLGLALLLKQNPMWFNALRGLAALFLIYIGWQSLQAARSPSRSGQDEAQSGRDKTLTRRKALSTGFLTNVLNPKATLFFLALYTVVPEPGTPTALLFVYGLWMSLATGLWFIGLSRLLEHPRLAARIQHQQALIERCMGLFLIILGLQLLLSPLLASMTA